MCLKIAVRETEASLASLLPDMNSPLMRRSSIILEDKGTTKKGVFAAVKQPSASDHSVLPQLSHLRLAVAQQGGEHLLCMLAQERSWVEDLDRSLRELDRAASDPDLAILGLIQFNDHIPGGYVGVVHGLSHVIDGGRGDVVG